MLQASPTPPPNSPTSLITLTLTILHSHRLTHHGHTLTTAAAAALRQGRGLKVNHCFNDESTKTGAKKKKKKGLKNEIESQNMHTWGSSWVKSEFSMIYKNFFEFLEVPAGWSITEIAIMDMTFT